MAQTLTPLAMAVLDLLHEHDMHPYEMRQMMLSRSTDLRIKLTAGTLYHAVERLQRDELISAVETNREGRRPERTVYTLTDAGRDAFSTRLTEMLAKVAEEYPQYPIALAFAHNLDQRDAAEQLRRRQMELAVQIAGLETIVERLTKDGTPRMYWIDVPYVLAMRKAELAWTIDLVDDLESGRLEWPNRDRPRLAVVANDEAAKENAQ